MRVIIRGVKIRAKEGFGDYLFQDNPTTPTT